MSDKKILKSSLLVKLPEGALRQLVDDGSEDKLWDGIAEALVPGYQQMVKLGEVREPDTAEDLDALEREYGFLKNPNLTEQERRDRIKALKYAKAGSGTAEAMQEALHLAGFTGLVVAEGRADADPPTMGAVAGEYVVNGFEYLTLFGYEFGCAAEEGPPETFEYGCTEVAGAYMYGCVPFREVRVPIVYEANENWNLVFYVAGDITLDVDGHVVSITSAEIPRYYRQVIREIILRLKPLQTWGYLAVDWQDGDHWGFGWFPMGISPHGL